MGALDFEGPDVPLLGLELDGIARTPASRRGVADAAPPEEQRRLLERTEHRPLGQPVGVVAAHFNTEVSPSWLFGERIDTTLYASVARSFWSLASSAPPIANSCSGGSSSRIEASDDRELIRAARSYSLAGSPML